MNGLAVVSEGTRRSVSPCALDGVCPESRSGLGHGVLRARGKAFRRAALWDGSTWPAPAVGRRRRRCSTTTSRSASTRAFIEADLEAGYATMWDAGGQE